MLLSADLDGTIMLRDFPSGERLRTLATNQDLVFSVAFSPDGQLVVWVNFNFTNGYVTVYNVGSSGISGLNLIDRNVFQNRVWRPQAWPS